jgi:hypothetical protein
MADARLLDSVEAVIEAEIEALLYWRFERPGCCRTRAAMLVPAALRERPDMSGR